MHSEEVYLYQNEDFLKAYQQFLSDGVVHSAKAMTEIAMGQAFAAGWMAAVQHCNSLNEKK